MNLCLDEFLGVLCFLVVPGVSSWVSAMQLSSALASDPHVSDSGGSQHSGLFLQGGLGLALALFKKQLEEREYCLRSYCLHPTVQLRPSGGRQATSFSKRVGRLSHSFDQLLSSPERSFRKKTNNNSKQLVLFKDIRPCGRCLTLVLEYISAMCNVCFK